MLCGDPAPALLELCAGCLADLPRLGPACPHCGEPTPGGRVCGACVRRPPPFDYLRAPFRYQLPVDWLVAGLKFERRLNHGRLLAEVLRDHWVPGDDTLPDLALPVPLHPARLRERGFNQTIELFVPLLADLGVALERGAVERTQPTVAQAGLHAGARRRNVRGAFRLAVDAGRVAGRHVVILDDVVTTGSTVAELARVLRRAGAARIGVWALARTVVS